MVTVNDRFENPVIAFRDAMLAAGLDCKSEVVADGVLHRFKSGSDRNPNAWYVLHADGLPAGAFGDYKRNISEKWRAGGTEPLSEIDRIKRDREIAQKKAERDQDQRRKNQSASERAQAILDRSAIPADDSHPYLQRKSVRAYPGIRIGYWPQRNKSNCLIIPLRTIDGNLKTIEAIFPSKPTAGRKTKDFLAGGEKQGAHFTIGDPATADTLIIGEGYSTTATIYEAKSYCTIAAMDSGNILAVALAYRERYPEATIIIAADNDRHNKAGNVGIIKATAAAQAVSGLLAIPVFADSEAGSDFNDLAQLHGLDAVRKAIEEAKPVSAPELTGNYAADLEALSKSKPLGDELKLAMQFVNRHIWRCPHSVPYAKLLNDLQSALNLNSRLTKKLEQRIYALEKRHKREAIESTALDPNTLRSHGVIYTQCTTPDECVAAIQSRPDCIHLIKAPIAFGKTKHVLKPIADALRGTAVAVTNRVSLTADLSHVLRLDNYRDLTPAQLEACSELAICLPSIANAKFADILNRATKSGGGILIDEVSAVTRECHAMTGTLKKRAADYWRQLMALAHDAPVVVGVDADLSTGDVLAWQESGRQIQVIHVEKKPTTSPLHALIGDYRQVWKMVENGLRGGGKGIVPTDSSKSAEKLAADMRSQFPDKRIMVIHGDAATGTHGEPEVIEFLKDVNTGVKDIDLLIYSPCIESGVSITTKHFDFVCAFYSGTVTPAAFFQMIRRDRTQQSFAIGIQGSGAHWGKEIDPVLILNDMDRAHRVNVAIQTKEHGTLIRPIPKTPWDQRVSEYSARENLATSAYARNLWHYLEAQGISVGKLDYSRIDTKRISAAKETIANESRDAILSATDISEDHRESIRRAYLPTREQKAQAARFDVKNDLALDAVGDSDIALWDGGHGSILVKRFTAMVDALIGLDADNRDDLENTPLALRRNRCATGRAIRKVFELAGIDTVTGAGDIDQARALAVWQAVHVNDALRATLANAGLMRIGKTPPKRAVAWFSSFLSKLGLVFDAPVRQGSRGERTRVYNIAQEPATAGGKRLPGWRTMREIATRRLERQRDEATDSTSNSEYKSILSFQPLLDAAAHDALLDVPPATDPTPPVPPPTGCDDPALAELRILYDQHRRNLEDAGIVRGVPRVRLSDWLARLGSDGRAMVDGLVEAGRVIINDLFVAEVSA